MRIAWQIGRAALVLSAGLLAACGQEELILPGEREAVRPANDVLAGDVAAADETDAGDGAASPADEPVPGLTLPPQRSNASWAYLNGAPTHLAEHAALGSALNRLWSVSIGEGANRRARLTSGPIVSGEAIYTIDTAAQVTAVSRSGRVLWDTDVTPEGERAAEGFGGGLTYDDGSVFVSSGFGEVLSLDAATGAIRWRAEIEAASRVAPAVSDDTIIAVGLNDVAFGIDRTTGDAVWRVAGFGEGAALVGGGTPAVRGPLVVIPFQSGAITAALTRSGRTVWTAAVSGGAARPRTLPDR